MAERGCLWQLITLLELCRIPFPPSTLCYHIPESYSLKKKKKQKRSLNNVIIPYFDVKCLENSRSWKYRSCLTNTRPIGMWIQFFLLTLSKAIFLESWWYSIINISMSPNTNFIHSLMKNFKVIITYYIFLKYDE